MLASCAADSDASPPPRRRRRPWWIPHFLGSVPDIEPRLLTLLGVIALALFFEQYDLSMLTSALKFIAADLGIAESDLGTYTALIRLGSLPAFVLIPFADRIGRRRVFLMSVAGTSVATLLTGLSQTALQFVVAQVVARTFLIAGIAVAFVIVSEEFPAAHRGWGIGMLGALAVSGNGLGALLFAAINRLPYGWRALYAVGMVPLFLLPLFQREIRETKRFERHQALRRSRAHAVSWSDSLRQFTGTHPIRVVCLGLIATLGTMGQMTVFQFTGYFTQTVHGWAPWQFSMMVIFGGAIGIIGNVVAGRLGDRIGRRAVGVTFMSLFPVFAWIFYRGPGWSLPGAWVCLVFCATAGEVVVRALASELFPTSHRGASSGSLALAGTVGAAAGLGLVGVGTHEPGDLARMISLLSLVVLLAALLLLPLPETHRRELEEITGEEL